MSEISPEDLEGDALIRWYQRSPADIEQARQAAAEKRYQDFFYGPSGTDPDSGFVQDTASIDHDVDPGFAGSLPASSQDADPGFTWVQTGPNRFRSIRLPSDDPSAGWLSLAPMAYDGAESSGDPSTAATYQDAGPSDVSASELDLTPQPISQIVGELKGPPTVAFGRSPTAARRPGTASTAIRHVQSSAAPARGPVAYGPTPPTPQSSQGHTTTGAARPHSSVGHPGFAESLIPVWGSGREAVADFQEGDYAGAALNGVLAASDLFLAESIAKGLAKGGFYVAKNVARKAAPYDWKEVVRPWMGRKGFLKPGQHGHHWAIPQNGWGKRVPDAIKNQPWNINPMPDAITHWRLEHRVGDLPRFGPLERYWRGTPTWSKVAVADAIGHPVAAATARPDERR